MRCDLCIIMAMNFIEMKKEIPTLTREERLELAHILHFCDMTDDKGYLAELGRRMAAMDSGDKVTQEEVERIHKELTAQGR